MCGGEAGSRYERWRRALCRGIMWSHSLALCLPFSPPLPSFLTPIRRPQHTHTHTHTWLISPSPRWSFISPPLVCHCAHLFSRDMAFYLRSNSHHFNRDKITLRQAQAPAVHVCVYMSSVHTAGCVHLRLRTFFLSDQASYVPPRNWLRRRARRSCRIRSAFGPGWHLAAWKLSDVNSNHFWMSRLRLLFCAVYLAPRSVWFPLFLWQVLGSGGETKGRRTERVPDNPSFFHHLLSMIEEALISGEFIAGKGPSSPSCRQPPVFLTSPPIGLHLNPHQLPVILIISDPAAFVPFPPQPLSKFCICRRQETKLWTNDNRVSAWDATLASNLSLSNPLLSNPLYIYFFNVIGLLWKTGGYIVITLSSPFFAS